MNPKTRKKNTKEKLDIRILESCTNFPYSRDSDYFPYLIKNQNKHLATKYGLSACYSTNFLNNFI